ncbi:Membrane protein of ER body protein [Spatholobus suberectus]|nr:Membrane protein of ER body protein [Spatholobus suberectus]
MNTQEDRYQELLGRRANFLLHAIVAVLSFLIFGSVPLVIYGLLISKNYYAEVKIAAVAATSVVCIILLAIGKVYTTRPPKSYVKTVLHYVSLALATSGISYIAGDLVKDLLDKISGSESGYVLTMPLSGTTRMKTAWMSY